MSSAKWCPDVYANYGGIMVFDGYLSALQVSSVTDYFLNLSSSNYRPFF